MSQIRWVKAPFWPGRLTILLLIIGALTVAYVPWQIDRHNRIMADPVEVDAIVVEVARSEGRRSPLIGYTPTVAYSSDGREFTERLDQVMFYSNHYTVGETVSVVYSRSDPTLVVANQNRYPFLFLLVGGGATLLAGVILFVRRFVQWVVSY